MSGHFNAIGAASRSAVSWREFFPIGLRYGEIEASIAQLKTWLIDPWCIATVTECEFDALRPVIKIFMR